MKERAKCLLFLFITCKVFTMITFTKTEIKEALRVAFEAGKQSQNHIIDNLPGCMQQVVSEVDYTFNDWLTSIINSSGDESILESILQIPLEDRIEEVITSLESIEGLEIYKNTAQKDDTKLIFFTVVPDAKSLFINFKSISHKEK